METGDEGKEWRIGGISSTSVLFGRLLLGLHNVRVVKELSEQHKVTEVHGRRQSDVQFGHPARLRATRLQVTIRSVVYEAPDQHLRQLACRDEHGHPGGWPIAHRPGRVIRIHHRVHRVVHNNEPPGRRRELVVREPRVQQHGDMMVPVQKDQRLFAEHDKYGVTQFGQFGQHEQPGPETGYRVVFNVTASET